MLKRLLARVVQDADEAPPLSYDEQRTKLEQGGLAVRRELAGRRDTKPEILYYLATDQASDVRGAIAANEATPVQADQLLLKDADGEVRAKLADKIARLVPEMSADEQDKIRELTLDILERLAQDALPQVRRAVAEQLKHANNVPRHVVNMLAMDVEDVVAGPILRFSPLLSDDDLLEVIRLSKAEGAAAAIACRANVAADVADAIAATGKVEAVAALLGNGSAQIREETLDQIIAQATKVERLHEPLVRRPALSMKAVKRISGFVAASLVRVLCERNDLDQGTTEHLVQVVQERFSDDEALVAGLLQVKPGQGEEDNGASEAEKARALHKQEKLDDDAIGEAIERKQRGFVNEALCLLSGLPRQSVVKILSCGNAKPVTALVWKSGLSMRTAILVQRHVARIAPQAILNARNGTDYPLNARELQDQLSLLGATANV